MCTPSPHPERTCGFLIQPVFCKKETMWFIGVEVEKETSAPPAKKDSGSAPAFTVSSDRTIQFILNEQSDWSLFITETELIAGKVIESEGALGTHLGIWSKHIHLACTELYFGVLEKTRLYSQGEGHCPIMTK